MTLRDTDGGKPLAQISVERYPPRIMQWNEFITALSSKGMTQAQIAKEAGCVQSTVSDLASGKASEPRGSLALALLRVGRAHGVRTPEIIKPTPRSEAKETQ